MMSVENFYWILYENLLKPGQLDCRYYYPFGTTENLSQFSEFRQYQLKREHHVLFHFDQEPLWNDSLGVIYDVGDKLIGPNRPSWSSKLLRILANSEKSDFKKQICRNRGMADWYFFYHGFAALDWFRDSIFVGNETEIINVFLSLNHLIRDLRSYRIGLLARLIESGVFHHGSISFHANQNDCLNEIKSPDTRLSKKSRSLITKNILFDIKLPLQIDNFVDGNASAHFGHQEYKLWQRSFVHIVNETVFYDQKLHLTEKTFKPIVALRPFVLVAAPGNLEYLRSYGFRTFNQWWDEGYDTIEDPDDRLDAITKIVEDLCQRPFAQIQEMLVDMQPVLEHNKRHFFGDFRRIIVDELVDNFDGCVRIWNNGRVDGRELPLLRNLESIKQVLLG